MVTGRTDSLCGVDVWDFYPVQDHEVARLIDDVESGAREEF